MCLGKASSFDNNILGTLEVCDTVCMPFMPIDGCANIDDPLSARPITLTEYGRYVG